MKRHTTAGVAKPGFRFCALKNCNKQIPSDGPTICPKHGEACRTCKGRGEILHSWSQCPGETPRHKKCRDCNGTGKSKKPNVGDLARAALGQLPSERLAAGK